MNITKIYYEELRSEKINGKWTSKKIGAEVSVEADDALQDCLGCVKEYVRRNLDFEMIKPKDYIDTKAIQQLIKELDEKIKFEYLPENEEKEVQLTLKSMKLGRIRTKNLEKSIQESVQKE